jgi:23S rRNA G2445 N2-methylase RlmL
MAAQTQQELPNAQIESHNIWQQPLSHSTLPEGDGLIVFNPPYGERLKLDFPKDIYYGKLLRQLIHPKVKALAFITLADVNVTKQIKAQRLPLKVVDQRRFEHGGLKVIFWIVSPSSAQ